MREALKRVEPVLGVVMMVPALKEQGMHGVVRGSERPVRLGSCLNGGSRIKRGN